MVFPRHPDGSRGRKGLIDLFLHAGAKADQNVGISSRDSQTAYTPIVQKILEAGRIQPGI